MSTGPRHIGKYELQECLGRGGMGEVWKAFDTQLLRYVAFKLIRAELQSDAHFIMRFQREAQAIASLHHPNIVKIFDFQIPQSLESDNTIYMVMDYIEGPTLSQYIRSIARINKLLSADDIIRLFVPISMAIDYAHHKGMIHRDIKPANIQLDNRLTNTRPHSDSHNLVGEPILTDFGIAKLLGSATITLNGWWLGTPRYTAPEQFRGFPGNKSSDLYSLGIILYEVCTGVLPFDGDSPGAILMQHINAEPTSPALINPHLSPALTAVILRSIAKDPADRFPNAASMSIALCEALDMPVSEGLRQAAQFTETIDRPSELGQRQPSHPISAISPGSWQASPVQSLSSLPSNITPIVNVSGASPIGHSTGNTPAILLPCLQMQGGPSSFTQQRIVEGEDLGRYIERLKQPMEERDVLLYASQILDILNNIGRRTPPIVYGGIQPGNILIGSRDKQAHLVGFETVLKDGTRNTQEKLTPFLGFPGYAPPEQLQGYADPRSDLYALAATMHHLLTNRNPRNHPPFVYPSVRLLNPRLSSKIEGVLTHALMIDITQRYQSAAEMKHDIDGILQRYYNTPDDISNDRQRTPAPIGVVDARTAASVPTINLSASMQRQSSYHQPLNIYAGTLQSVSQQRHRGNRMGNVILVMLIILLTTAGLSLFQLFPRNGQKMGSIHKTPTATLPNGIGVTRAPDGEYIGVSDGTFAFDRQRRDSNLKTQAAEQLSTNNFGSADSLWQQAITEDTNDAETLIYMEDRRILDSGNPYITIVLGTTLSGDTNSIAVGREATEAAYVAQKEYNTASKLPGGMKVRLLIANSGKVSTYVTAVARQIVKLVQKDKTIVAVMGWTSTATTLNAIGVLSSAKIPMVANSGADVLTGRSSYFFRVVPPASVAGRIGAVYAEQTLHARKAAVFVDVKNNFVLGLANGFTNRFTSDGNTIVATENYTVGASGTLSVLLQDALSQHPDVIYFAGYPGDMGGILAHLQPSDPRVLGGSSLYQLGGYPAAAQRGLGHLRFTAYSYPDEWNILEPGAKKRPFFADYKADYDPNNQHSASPYGFDRPDGTTMELYDAISVLLYGCGIALTAKPTIIGSDIQHALTQVTGKQAFQGVTSQISFGSDSNPIDRAVVIICVDKGRFFKMDGMYGKFMIGEADRAQVFTPSACS